MNLLKAAKDPYSESYKTLMKETEDVKNRCKDIPWFCITRINCQNDYITQGNLWLQGNLYQITNSIFHRTKTKNLTLYGHTRDPKEPKKSWERKIELEESVHGILYSPWNSPARILEWVAFPSPEDLPNPGIKPKSPALLVDSLPTEPRGKPKNTGVGSLSLLQRIFPTQESNQSLLNCRQILYQLSYQGSSGFTLAKLTHE